MGAAEALRRKSVPSGTGVVSLRNKWGHRPEVLTLGMLLATAVLSFTSVSALAADPLAGPWELNVAKSKSTGTLPANQARPHDVTGLQEKMVAKGVDAQGKPMLAEFTASRDGKEYPYRSPQAGMIALTLVDATKVNLTLKKEGKLVGTGTRTVSKDGKTMSLSGKVNDAVGKLVESTLVFDKR